MAKSLIRGLIDRAIGGQPGADLVADLAAIEGSFGVLADQDSFAAVRPPRPWHDREDFWCREDFLV